MRGGKLMMTGLLVMVGMTVVAVLAQEPVLNVEPPAANPLPDTDTSLAPTNTAAPSLVEPGPSTNAVPVPVVEQAVPTNAPVAAPMVAPVLPAVPLVTKAPAEEVVVPEVDRVAEWKSANWQIGTRYTKIQLQDKTRGEPFNGSFVGSLTEIKEEQDSIPNKVYIQGRLPKTPCWIGVSYDHARARTMDDGDGDGIPDTKGGDGYVDIQGYIPYLQLALANKTRLTPYLQVGYAFYQSKFDAFPSWSNGGRKAMNLDSTSGVEFGGGVHVRIYNNWAADIFAKSMQVDDVKGDYTMDGNKQSDVIFTMSYVAYGAGVSCRF